MPNPARLQLPELVEKFLEDVVKYTNKDDPYPLTWPTPTGRNGELYNFRVKMTNAFWTHFMNDGKRKLQEYNRKNGSSVHIIRDHTVNITDVENLNLYLRRRILKLFNDQDMTPPEMVVKNGYVTITGMAKMGTKRYRSTELSVLLGLDYNDWNGNAINKMLTVTERRNMEEGKLTWGS